MNADVRKDVYAYLEQKPDNLRRIAAKLIEIIILGQPGLEMAMKWGRPTFGLNGDFHHWICAVQVLKSKVSLMFHFGGLLSDKKHRLMAGTGKFLRKIEYNTVDSIDEEEINYFLQQAVEKLPYFKENWKDI